MFFILSNSLSEAKHYAQETKRKQWRYIYGILSLRGFKNITFVRVGNWRRRKDLGEIIHHLKKLEAKEVYR